MYSGVERRHWNDKEETPFHSRFQETGGARGAPGARHGAGDRGAVARHEVHANQASAWKRQAVEDPDEVFSQPGSKRGGEHSATIRDLHAKIGELTVERDFFLRGSAR